MKSTILKIAVSAALVTGASPAFADLIYVTGTQTPGTGLGVVETVTTVQDNDNGPSQNGTQSGCVSYSGGDPGTPDETCVAGLGLEGGDNTAGNAGNNTWLLSDIDQLTDAGQLGFVVNVSEAGNEFPATLTDLYMSLYSTSGTLLGTFSYTGEDLDLYDGGGIGQSGVHRFVLDDDQAAQAALLCPDLTLCVVGGGIQFLEGTTDTTPDTVRVAAFDLAAIREAQAEAPEGFAQDIINVDGSQTRQALRDFFQTLPIIGLFRPFFF